MTEMTDKKRLIVLDDLRKPKYQQTLKSYLRSTVKLEKSAIVYQDQVVQFGTPDNKLLNKLLKEFHDNGAEALKDFEKWLVKHDGCTEAKARTHRKWIWTCLVLTHDDASNTSDLALILGNTSYSHSSMISLKAALKRWAMYTQDANLLTTLHLHHQAKRYKQFKRATQNPDKYVPYTDEEWKDLLKAQNKWNQDPRYPWAWAVLGLLIKTGMIIRSELVFVTRDAIVTALKTDALRVWNTSKHGRVIPTNLIKPELEALVAFPANWDRLADLIAPAKLPNKRDATATYKVSALAKEMFDVAGIVFDGKSVRLRYIRLKFTASVKLWNATENLIAVSNFLGHRNLTQTRAWLGSHVRDWVVAYG